MIFSWDSTKADSNQQKHGVSFELAAKVFDDPLHVSVLERIENYEERWQTLGLVEGIVLLLVAHTVVDDDDDTKIRIISARRATKHERKVYEQG